MENKVLTAKDFYESTKGTIHAYVCPDCGTMHIVNNDGEYICAQCGHEFVAEWDVEEYRYGIDWYNYYYDLVCHAACTDAKTPVKSLGIKMPLANGTYAGSADEVLSQPIDVKRLFKSIPETMRKAIHSYRVVELPNFQGKDEFYKLIKQYIAKKQKDTFFKKVGRGIATPVIAIACFFMAIGDIFFADDTPRLSKKDEKIVKTLMFLNLMTD